MTYCFALFTSGNNVWASDLGNSLIRSRVVTFDREHAQMGFAPAQPCP